MKSVIWQAGLALAIVGGLAGGARAQGPLVPPGPPGPGMKTLAQVEPRTLITNLPYTISSAGSYYLGTNLESSVGGITVIATNVTIDLNGFALISHGDFSYAVDGGWASQNVTVRNGAISKWGWGLRLLDQARLVHLLVSASTVDDDAAIKIGAHSAVTDCRITGNAGAGIWMGNSCRIADCLANNNGWDAITGGKDLVVERCVATGNATYGIIGADHTTLAECVASGNGDTGLLLGEGSVIRNTTAISNRVIGMAVSDQCVVEGCTVSMNAESASGLLWGPAAILAGNGCVIKDCAVASNGLDGIAAQIGSTVKDCSVMGNARHGIYVLDGSTVVGCTLRGNGGDGIQVTGGCRVQDNTCDQNGTLTNAAGIHGTQTSSRIEGNNTTYNNSAGIRLDAGGNVVVRNSSRGSASNYALAAGNDVGPIGSATNNTSPWANISY